MKKKVNQRKKLKQKRNVLFFNYYDIRSKQFCFIVCYLYLLFVLVFSIKNMFRFNNKIENGKFKFK